MTRHSTENTYLNSGINLVFERSNVRRWLHEFKWLSLILEIGNRERMAVALVVYGL